MKKIALLLSAGLVAGALVLPATPAHATFAGAATCDVTLDIWPTTATRANSSSCTGTAVGVATTIPGIPPVPPVPPPPPPPLATCPHAGVPPTQCTFEATVGAYNETCVGPLPPPVGTASGNLIVDGTPQGTYNWLRVGLTAVLVPVAPGTSVGVAAFLPHPPIPTCAAPGPLTATVVGVAVAP